MSKTRENKIEKSTNNVSYHPLFPTNESALKDTTTVFSDHLARIATVTVSQGDKKVELTVMTENQAEHGSLGSGFDDYDVNLDKEGVEARRNRILDADCKAVKENNVSIFCTQESSWIDKKFFEEKFDKNWGVITTLGGLKILYDKRVLDLEKVVQPDYNKPSPVAIDHLQVSFKTTPDQIPLIIHNIHLSHRDLPAEQEEFILRLPDKKTHNTFVLGDTNGRVSHYKDICLINGVVGKSFRDGTHQGCDGTDVILGVNGIIKSDQVNPLTGKKFAFSKEQWAEWRKNYTEFQLTETERQRPLLCIGDYEFGERNYYRGLLNSNQISYCESNSLSVGISSNMFNERMVALQYQHENNKSSDINLGIFLQKCLLNDNKLGIRLEKTYGNASMICFHPDNTEACQAIGKLIELYKDREYTSNFLNTFNTAKSRIDSFYKILDISLHKLSEKESKLLAQKSVIEKAEFLEQEMKKNEDSWIAVIWNLAKEFPDGHVKSKAEYDKKVLQQLYAMELQKKTLGFANPGALKRAGLINSSAISGSKAAVIMRNLSIDQMDIFIEQLFKDIERKNKESSTKGEAIQLLEKLNIKKPAEKKATNTATITTKTTIAKPATTIVTANIASSTANTATNPTTTSTVTVNTVTSPLRSHSTFEIEEPKKNSRNAGDKKDKGDKKANRRTHGAS